MVVVRKLELYGAAIAGRRVRKTVGGRGRGFLLKTLCPQTCRHTHAHTHTCSHTHSYPYVTHTTHAEYTLTHPRKHIHLQIYTLTHTFS